jgi:hypothetical protein
MAHWISLFIPLRSAQAPEREAVINALRALLSAPPYQPFDPFGGFPDKSYPQAARLFVAPTPLLAEVTGDAWLRVIAAPDSAALDDLAARLCGAYGALTLIAALDASEVRLTVYQAGAPVDPTETLMAHAPDAAAFRAALALDAKAGKAASDDVPIAQLPPDIRSMAGQLNQRQVNRLYARMTRHLLGKDQRQAAQSLLVATAPEWESAAGVKLRAVLASLGLSSGWMTPDYVLLRDAYQAAGRRARHPSAHLLPGAAEALAAVPDALAYTPLFAGIVEAAP